MITQSKPKLTIDKINLITNEEIEAEKYQIYINHGTYFIAVMPMTYGKGRIIIADDLTDIRNAWCYETLIDALLALAAWDSSSNNEPTGWHRNPIDGRRRPGGDPSKEYNHR